MKQINATQTTISGVFSLLLAALLLVSAAPMGTRIEQSWGLRWLFLLRGAISAPSDLSIVALSSGAAERMSLSKYSGNWPRTVHAELVQRLCTSGVRLTVFDIAFKGEHSSEEDTAFEQALAQCPNVVLFTYLKREQVPTGSGFVDIEQEVPPLDRFAKHALASGSFTLPKYPAQVTSTAIVTEVGAERRATQPLLAYLALIPDRDLVALLKAGLPRTELALDLQARTRQLLGLSQSLQASHLNHDQKRLLALLQGRSNFYINFYGPSRTLETRDIDRVLALNDERLKQAFAGKVVYIGYSDNRQTEQQDAYRTVFSDDLGLDLSGVEISATVLANLLHAQELMRLDALSFVLLLAAVALFVYLLNKCPFVWNAGLQFGIIFGYLYLCFYLFVNSHMWLPIVMPALVILVCNGWAFARRYCERKIRVQEVQYALAQYLPESAAKTLSKSVANLESQRQLVQGVCLMTDIQGYTRLSESLEPAELHRLMNEYYAVLIATVEKHGGFVANLVGDAMLALWTGSDIDKPMCQAAYAAAAELQERISADPNLASKLPTCVALHGGQFSLGNLGGRGHYEYSPVGDIINTVSRVEHFNRDLNTQFLCTEVIAKNIQARPGAPVLKELGEYTFRNKSEAMKLFTYTNV